MPERNQEVHERLKALLPKIFQGVYLRSHCALGGGMALSLSLPLRRNSTGIDLVDLGGKTREWYERANLVADELRNAGERAGYRVALSVRNTTEATMFYRSGTGEERFKVSVQHGPAVLFPPAARQTCAGDVPMLALEEVIGSKIALLSRPRLRGGKRYSDVFDLYASTWSGEVDPAKVRKAFVFAATGLNVRVDNRFWLRQMLDWHDPRRLEDGIMEVTGQVVPAAVAKEAILRRYEVVCMLGLNERRYNQKRVPAGEDPVSYLLAL